MALTPQVPQSFPRGATVLFSTTFFDVNGVATNPPAAFVHVNYQEPPPGQALIDLDIPMTAPVSGNLWTALWDTRNVGEGVVAWSIRSSGAGIPFAVQDGIFVLTSNPANQLSFA